MEFKVTTKQVVESVKKVCVKAGYCKMQYLLMPFRRKAYTRGTYGWNYDVFEPFNDGVVICTGYRGMPGKWLDYVEEYNEAARKIWATDKKYELKEARTMLLLKELLEKNGIN